MLYLGAENSLVYIMYEYIDLFITCVESVSPRGFIVTPNMPGILLGSQGIAMDEYFLL